MQVHIIVVRTLFWNASYYYNIYLGIVCAHGTCEYYEGYHCGIDLWKGEYVYNCVCSRWQVFRDYSLITGRGGGGLQVKFYAYKRGILFSHTKGYALKALRLLMRMFYL